MYKIAAGNGFGATKVLNIEALSLAISPADPKIAIAGGEPAAIYVSEDAGETWNERPAFKEVPESSKWYHPAPMAPPHVLGLVAHPSRPDIFHAGIEVGGVYLTTDFGEHFEGLNDGLYEDVHNLAGHPETGDLIFAVTGKGVYKTVDGGGEWRDITGTMTRKYAAAVAFLPDNHVVAAAAKGAPWGASEGASAVIYRSSDGGESWVEAMAGLPDSLGGVPRAFVPCSSNPWKVYSGVASGQLLVSDDEAQSWRILSDQLPPIYAVALADQV